MLRAEMVWKMPRKRCHNDKNRKFIDIFTRPKRTEQEAIQTRFVSLLPCVKQVARSTSKRFFTILSMFAESNLRLHAA